MSDDPLTASAQLPQRQAASEDADLELSEDEAQSVGLFFALGTQWRRHALSGARLGLDYQAIPATAAMMKVDMTPRRFADLSIMEGAALAELGRHSR